MSRAMNMTPELVKAALRAPFPFFGGKSRVSHIVWDRFGDVPNYVEPFFGSGAVLLGRPHAPRIETVNDIDLYIANFWRSLKHAPAEVAKHCDDPVNEADLHSRHLWLVNEGRKRLQRIKKSPTFYDARIAGWWVWGQALWIGSGWCAGADWNQRVGSTAHTRNGNTSTQKRRPQLAGRGVHASGLIARTGGLENYLHDLSVRLRRVRVCVGDWKRVLTQSVTTYIGVTAVFLDPPYKQSMRSILYAQDTDISGDVREWAIKNGDNPKYRIALCGYAGEHEMPADWQCVKWKAHGGYSRSARGVANRSRERIWFSPHCLQAELPLFAEPE